MAYFNWSIVESYIYSVTTYGWSHFFCSVTQVLAIAPRSSIFILARGSIVFGVSGIHAGFLMVLLKPEPWAFHYAPLLCATLAIEVLSISGSISGTMIAEGLSYVCCFYRSKVQIANKYRDVPIWDSMLRGCVTLGIYTATTVVILAVERRQTSRPLLRTFVTLFAACAHAIILSIVYYVNLHLVKGVQQLNTLEAAVMGLSLPASFIVFQSVSAVLLVKHSLKHSTFQPAAILSTLSLQPWLGFLQTLVPVWRWGACLIFLGTERAIHIFSCFRDRLERQFTSRRALMYWLAASAVQAYFAGLGLAILQQIFSAWLILDYEPPLPNSSSWTSLYHSVWYDIISLRGKKGDSRPDVEWITGALLGAGTFMTISSVTHIGMMVVTNWHSIWTSIRGMRNNFGA